MTPAAEQNMARMAPLLGELVSRLRGEQESWPDLLCPKCGCVLFVWLGVHSKIWHARHVDQTFLPGTLAACPLTRANWRGESDDRAAFHVAFPSLNPLLPDPEILDAVVRGARLAAGILLRNSRKHRNRTRA